MCPLADYQPSVDPLDHRLRNSQCDVHAVTTPRMLPSYLQGPWLITEDPGHGARADLPRRREFPHGIVAFRGACRRRNLSYSQMFMANPRSQFFAFIPLPHFSSASFVLLRPHQLS